MGEENNISIKKYDENPSKTFVVDSKNNIYIGIKNFYNSFCYYISAIQRLHSSKTLGENLNNMFQIKKDTNNIVSKEIETSKKIFSILISYNKINQNNFKTISEEIIKYKDEVILPMFNDNMKNGGDPQLILVRLFFPIIFHYTTTDIFIDILKELNFSKVHFPNTLYLNSEFNILTEQYSQFNKTLNKWYDKMLNYLNDPNNKFNESTFMSTFKVSTLCLFFADVYERESVASFSGHAVTIVLGKDDIFYVIDDNVNILPFTEYISLQRSCIHEMEIKDLTEDAIDKLKQIDFIELNRRYYRTVIKFKSNSENILQSFNETIYPNLDENLNKKILTPNSNSDFMIGGKINKQFLQLFLNHPFGKLYLIILFIFVIILILSIIQYLYKLCKIKCLKTELEELENKKNKYLQHSRFNGFPSPNINTAIIDDAPKEDILNENFKPKLNFANYNFNFI